MTDTRPANIDREPELAGQTHRRTVSKVKIGEAVESGDRHVIVSKVEGDVATVTLRKVEGENVEIRDPTMRDNPWIGEAEIGGVTIDEEFTVIVGHKIRVGDWRQFRILEVDGDDVTIAVVGPA